MKILFVDPHDSSIFSFRKEVLDELINQKFEVIICANSTERLQSEYSEKAKKIIDLKLNLKSKNIFSNLRLIKQYKQIIKNEKPDFILSYKVKPNIYCAFSAKKCIQIANITGLGNIFRKKGFLSKLGVIFYKIAFKNVDFIFFQNEYGYKFFKDHKIPIKEYKIIPGSGVNCEKFIPSLRDSNKDKIDFLFASRGIKEKGFDLLLEAIPIILKETKKVCFNFLSAEENIFLDKRLVELLNKYPENITIIDRCNDMQKVYVMNDFLIAPSFYKEGISNVLLESLACETPIITTNDNPGCLEVLRESENGYGVRSNNLDDLVEAIKKAINTPQNQIRKMGKNGRAFVSENFNRKDVVKSYLDVINTFIRQKR